VASDAIRLDVSGIDETVHRRFSLALFPNRAQSPTQMDAQKEPTATRRVRHDRTGTLPRARTRRNRNAAFQSAAILNPLIAAHMLRADDLVRISLAFEPKCYNWAADPELGPAPK
jgi:hypothetical protein